MKQKNRSILFFLILLPICIVYIFCFSPFNLRTKSQCDIQLIVDNEITTSSEFIDLAMINLTTYDYNISPYPYLLQIWENGEWVSLELLSNRPFREISKRFPANNTIHFHIPIIEYYGDYLSIGYYRLIPRLDTILANHPLIVEPDAWYFHIKR